MDIKKEFNNYHYPLNCDILIKQEPEEEPLELNNFANITIKKEYTSENEDEEESDYSDNGKFVIKQEFTEDNEECLISNNLQIKVEKLDPNTKEKPHGLFRNESLERQNQIDKNIKNSGKHSIQCDICSFTTIDNSYMQIHKKVHRTSVQSCDMCSYMCGSVLKLKHHKRKKHMKLEDLVVHCKDCSFSSTVKQKLITHRRENHNKRRDGKVSCTYCSYRCKEINMEKHKAEFHHDHTYCLKFKFF